jgi:hypothetical protein
VEIGEAQELLHTFKWVRGLQLKDVDFKFDVKTVVTKFYSKN